LTNGKGVAPDESSPTTAAEPGGVGCNTTKGTHGTATISPSEVRKKKKKQGMTMRELVENGCRNSDD